MAQMAQLSDPAAYLCEIFWDKVFMVGSLIPSKPYNDDEALLARGSALFDDVYASPVRKRR
jgi:hypothetical protein